MRELEVQVGEVHRVRQHLAEHAVEPAVVQAARAQDQVARELSGSVRRSVGHVSLSGSVGESTRCAERREALAHARLARQVDFATTQPRPRGTRCSIRPQ